MEDEMHTQYNIGVNYFINYQWMIQLVISRQYRKYNLITTDQGSFTPVKTRYRKCWLKLSSYSSNELKVKGYKIAMNDVIIVVKR